MPPVKKNKTLESSNCTENHSEIYCCYYLYYKFMFINDVCFKYLIYFEKLFETCASTICIDYLNEKLIFLKASTEIQ